MLSTGEEPSWQSSVFTFTHQMATQSAAADRDGFPAGCGPRVFSVRSPGNPKENASCFQLCALPPLCSTSLTGESENETGTNTPLLAVKYGLATGSFHETDLAVSRQAAGRGTGTGSFLLQRCIPHSRQGAEVTGLRVFSIMLMPCPGLDLFSMHWQRLEASVGAAGLPKPPHRPCQVSIVNTACVAREQHKQCIFCVKGDLLP